MNIVKLAESGLIPDAAIRFGVRRLLHQRLSSLPVGPEQREQHVAAFAAELAKGPLVEAAAAANEQHYEVPAAFFEQVLGPHMKYSSCLFPTPTASLADAEEEMLEATCQRAEIIDGMNVLELGCGWGSLTLHIAERFPGCHVTAVSNSASQKAYIERQSAARSLSNVRVVTSNMSDFETDDDFDRVVSVEMFEHMRNLEQLLHRIAGWLRPNGKAFVHIFCHADSPYCFGFWRRNGLDGEALLHRRNDALRRSVGTVSPRLADRDAMARKRAPLLANMRSLAGQSGPKPEPRARQPLASWSSRPNSAAALADVLHGLCRAISLSWR